jgi:hypothetical protein
MQNKEDDSIVPGVRVGKYFLKWDLDTLINQLPDDYFVKEGKYCWFVIFDYYAIGIRKFDNKIDSISVKNNFKENFMHKMTCNNTFKEIEANVEDLIDETEYYYFPNYPGMNLYFEDEREGQEWNEVKLKMVFIHDPSFDWNKEFSLEDYERMEQTHYSCPFPLEKLRKSKENNGESALE